MESRLHQLLSETGYTCDTMGGSPGDGNYIIAGVSPAYQSSALSDNPVILISGIAGVRLIWRWRTRGETAGAQFW